MILDRKILPIEKQTSVKDLEIEKLFFHSWCGFSNTKLISIKIQVSSLFHEMFHLLYLNPAAMIWSLDFLFPYT